MQSNEDEDNPLAALIKRAEEEGTNNNDGNDPIIVFNGSNENDEDEQDNGPITLSIRQPSFSHLTCGKLVPKGGNESISKSNKNFQFKQNDSLSKEKHSSSYANIKVIIDSDLNKEIEGIRSSNLVPDANNQSNPILVLTGNGDDENEDDDENNAPIGLSVRQPSFASLCSNHIIPKGGLETGEMPIVIEEEPQKPPVSNQQDDDAEDNLAPVLGLQVRQSSYANLHLNAPQKEEVSDLMKLTIKEEDSKQIKDESKNNNISANDSNPVIVLTGNDENADEEDESNAPIGLSIRQPSFASLCNHIIPKGGLESGEMPMVIEEEWPGEVNEKEVEEIKEIENEIENDNGPLVLNVRQSSYANLHFEGQPSNQIPSIETIPDEEEKPNQSKNENKIAENEDTIIVLTKDDDEKDDGAPIGLSVRQPSFASLTGNVIPKGGFQPTVPTITEESNDGNVLDQEISDVDIDSSSDAENENVVPNSNVVQNQHQTNESENKDNNDIINDDDKKEPAIKDKILSSLLSINKQWWEEIGYKPPDNIHSAFPRSNSMFQVPAKEFMKNSFGSSNNNETDLNKKSSDSSFSPIKKRPSHSLYQGQLNTIQDLLKDSDSTKVSSRKGELTKEKRGPSIYRVNSYGNKTELIEVEMPLLREINGEEENEDEEENQFLNDSRPIITNYNTNDEENNKPSKLIDDQPAESSITQTPNTSNNPNTKDQGKKITRGPSMQRVNSFGNASTLMVVEMPTISEETQNQNKNNIKSINEDNEEENLYEEYEEEDEEEDNHGIPPEILKMMTKPRDPIVYSALCGASINGYKRETVHRALTDLKSMNKKCIDRDLNDESEFLTRVIDAIRQDAARDDPYFEVEEQMRETEVELQGKLADWQNIYEELDEEYKVQVEECEQRYQEDLLSLEKQFHTTTASSSPDSNKRPNSDSKLNQDQQAENEEKTDDTTEKTENGITVIDSNPQYSGNKKRSIVPSNSPSNRKRHSSLTPNSASILSPSISGKPFQPQKPQRRSKAAVFSSTSPKPQPQLFQTISPVISPDAIKMKEKVQKMIKAQRFEESFELSLKYYKQQMTEHQKQVNKRSQAFLAAKTALKQKHEDEKKEIEFNFQAKRAEFTKKREQSLVPLRQQIIQLRKMKTLIEEGEKNEKFNETMQPRLRASRTRKGRVANLALPPLSRSSNA